jgi:hypothetical protein
MLAKPAHLPAAGAWPSASPDLFAVHLPSRQIAAAATQIRGNILATSRSSNASRKTDDLDDVDAGGRIYTF